MKLHENARSILAAGDKALVPFFTAGYPDDETFLKLLETAQRAGCSIVEVGMPFSDPLADGPVIQASSMEALEGGVTLEGTLNLIKESSLNHETSVVLMGYLNPILRMGIETFARRAAEAGIAGVILPDVPVEESHEIRGIMKGCGVCFVDLLAPTSGEERIARIAGSAEGFLYLVSLTGVTGIRDSLSEELEPFVRRVRDHTDIPLYAGFGISSPRIASEAARIADGVIIGSALIRIIQSSRDPVPRVEKFLNDIRGAVIPKERNRR